VLPGDGIGPEVVDASVQVLDRLGVALDLRFGDIGWEFWRNEGTPVPARTWDLIAATDTCLVGAVTSKPPREAGQELAEHLQSDGHSYVSPVVQLRQRLGLFANVRPITDIRHGSFDFVVIRENTEGLYAGFDTYGLDDGLWEVVQGHPNAAGSGQQGTSASIRLQTTAGLDQLFRFGLEYARRHGHQRLTVADKPNVLRGSGTHLRERLEQISAEYPEIETEILNVDAVALWMVRRPERFAVIVAENMFGDILSDLGAGVMGGLGLAASGNIGAQGSYFEPVHGSAPPLVGTGRANPMAILLSLELMLSHLGLDVPARELRRAVVEVATAGRTVTYDLGGSATTREVAAAVAEALRVAGMPAGVADE